MKRLLACVVLISACLVAGVGTVAAPAGAADAAAERGFLDRINAARSAAGLGGLVEDPAVTAIARAWSDKMAATGNLAHNPSVSTLLPGGWTRWAENVAYGGSVASVHDNLMRSSGHRTNILGPYQQVGIGVSYGRGSLWVTQVFVQRAAAAPAPAPTVCGAANPPAAPSPNGATGYYVLGHDGGIFAYGNAPFRGSLPGLGIRAESRLLAVTPSQNGYWVLGRDGGIFSFGDATYLGSIPGLRLPVPVDAIDLKPTPSGRGYWILSGDGGIFSFGDARFLGSLPGVGVRTRAVKIIPTPSGNGYWILGADGGIFSFGDARFFGSLPGSGVRNVSVSLAATPSGGGYWVLGIDGGIFAYGDARFYGSVPGTCSAALGVQLVRSATGAGYYVLSDTGRVFAFGDAPHLGEPSKYGIAARDLSMVKR